MVKLCDDCRKRYNAEQRMYRKKNLLKIRAYNTKYKREHYIPKQRKLKEPIPSLPKPVKPKTYHDYVKEVDCGVLTKSFYRLDK